MNLQGLKDTCIKRLTLMGVEDKRGLCRVPSQIGTNQADSENCDHLIKGQGDEH